MSYFESSIATLAAINAVETRKKEQQQKGAWD